MLFNACNSLKYSEKYMFSLRKCKISFSSQARAVDLVCCAWTPSDGGVQHLFFYKFLPDGASSNKWRSLFRRNAGKCSAKCSACEGFAGKRSATSYAGALFAAEWAFAALILNFIYDPGRILLKQFWDRNLAPPTMICASLAWWQPPHSSACLEFHPKVF